MYNETPPPPPLFRREEMVRTLKGKRKAWTLLMKLVQLIKAKIEPVNFENLTIRRAILNQDRVGIMCQTYCKNEQLWSSTYIAKISDKMKVRMDDGTEAEGGDKAILL